MVIAGNSSGDVQLHEKLQLWVEWLVSMDLVVTEVLQLQVMEDGGAKLMHIL